jgi:hypothetical protein
MKHLVKHFVYKHIVGLWNNFCLLYYTLRSTLGAGIRLASHCDHIPNPQSILVLIKEPFCWQHVHCSLQLRLNSSYPVMLELS